MTLKTLDNALNLLTYFTVQQPAWGVRALAKQSGVHPAIVHRVLATFAESGFLVQNEESGKYSLGLRVFELGQVVRKTFSPSEAVQPILQRLAEQSGETVFLSWLDGEEGLCVGMVQSQHQLRFSIELGQRFPLYAGAHAKAILAFQTTSFQEQSFAEGVAAGVSMPSWEAFQARLADVRAQGWAYTHGESAASVAGLAIPLMARDHQTVTGSITIAGPQDRLREESVTELLTHLRDSAKRLEDVIGFVS